MKTKRLKTSADYPQLSLRFSSDYDKDQLEAQIVSILNKRIKNWKKGELKPKKNDIIVEALTIGLKTINEKINR